MKRSARSCWLVPGFCRIHNYLKGNYFCIFISLEIVVSLSFLLSIFLERFYYLSIYADLFSFLNIYRICFIFQEGDLLSFLNGMLFYACLSKNRMFYYLFNCLPRFFEKNTLKIL